MHEQLPGDKGCALLVCHDSLPDKKRTSFVLMETSDSR